MRKFTEMVREQPRDCHSEASSFGAEGSMQFVGAGGAGGESIDPSARKERGPQDDKSIERVTDQTLRLTERGVSLLSLKRRASHDGADQGVRPYVRTT